MTDESGETVEQSLGIEYVRETINRTQADQDQKY